MKHACKNSEPGLLALIGRTCPTGRCKGRACATRTGGCESKRQTSHTKDLKNDSCYIQLSTKLRSEFDKRERWLSSGRMLCSLLLCPSRELNALFTQNPHW